MPAEQINRGDEVEVIFREGINPIRGTVINAPHREESYEKLGWIIKDEAGMIYSLGNYSYIRKLK
jgi:hypothetical protein|tara:strand:+ start:261 stop:455 length:195 start_codon:yes stop_codon:yes gene_type:complete